MENKNSAGPSEKLQLPMSRTAGPQAKVAKFPAPHLMEDRFLPPTGRFMAPPEGHIDGPYPAVIGMVEPFWSGNLLSAPHPAPSQYNLPDFSKGGAYTTEQSRRPPGPQSLPEPDVTPSPVLTPTYCSNCKKMFATIEAYTRHEPMHALTVKLFPCPECGKYYRHNTALVIHRRTHTGEKPYGCPECGRRFNARSSLVTHGKIHAGKKVYKCSECGKSFPRTDDLFHHQLLHNRERKFTCNDCGKCFKAEPELTAHRRVHPAEELFLCSGCGRDFTQYSKLLRHQKSHPQPPPVLITGERLLASDQ